MQGKIANDFQNIVTPNSRRRIKFIIFFLVFWLEILGLASYFSVLPILLILNFRVSFCYSGIFQAL